MNRTPRKITSKKKQDFKKKRWVLQLILFVFLVVQLMAFLVWQNVKGLELDESIQKLEKGYIHLYNVYQKELLDYTRLANSNEMRELAKRNLNLVETRHSDFVVVDMQDIEKEERKNIRLEH